MTTIPDGPPEEGAVHLGGDHWYTPIYRDGDWVGIQEWHHNQRDEWCAGWVPFAGAPTRAGTSWDTLSLDPLTLSPSLLCSCGSHGFIRDGAWVDA